MLGLHVNVGCPLLNDLLAILPHGEEWAVAGISCTKVTVPTGGQLSSLGVGIKLGDLPASRPKTPLWFRPCQRQESFRVGLSSTFLHPPVLSHWSRITQQLHDGIVQYHGLRDADPRCHLLAEQPAHFWPQRPEQKALP